MPAECSLRHPDVSGHFNGTEFFSDRLDVSEFLPVQEMERAACNPRAPECSRN
jgi:hypothetical protein